MSWIILNHRLSGATGAYVVSQHLERKREVLLTWHNMIDAILEKSVQIAL